MKALLVPVEPVPAAPAAAPARHARKLAFLFGVLATAFALYVVQAIVGALQ